MSATVTDIFSRFRRPPAATQQGRERVDAELRGKVTATILAQARARVVRSIVGGRSVKDAVRSAVAWTLEADHGDLPDPPRAA